MNKTTLIVGLGSPHGDDQIGWRVAERLLETMDAAESVSIRRAASPSDLLDWLDGVEQLIVCDACQRISSPCTVHCWRWPDAPLGRLRNDSTHGLSLADVLNVADELKRLPNDVVIWAAEMESCHIGAAMSSSAEAAVVQIGNAIALQCCRLDRSDQGRGASWTASTTT